MRKTEFFQYFYNNQSKETGGEKALEHRLPPDYEVISSTVEYSDEPIGELDPQRLLEGLPAWRTHSTVKQKKKPVLIFCDPISQESNQTRIQQIVRALLRLGYQIFSWNGEDLDPITVAWCYASIGVIFYDVALPSFGDLKKAAWKKYQFTADQLFYLDYSYFSNLPQGRYYGRDLFVRDTFQFREELRPETIASIREAISIIIETSEDWTPDKDNQGIIRHEIQTSGIYCESLEVEFVNSRSTEDDLKGIRSQDYRSVFNRMRDGEHDLNLKSELLAVTEITLDSEEVQQPEVVEPDILFSIITNCKNLEHIKFVECNFRKFDQYEVSDDEKIAAKNIIALTIENKFDERSYIETMKRLLTLFPSTQSLKMNGVYVGQDLSEISTIPAVPLEYLNCGRVKNGEIIQVICGNSSTTLKSLSIEWSHHSTGEGIGDHYPKMNSLKSIFINRHGNQSHDGIYHSIIENSAKLRILDGVWIHQIDVSIPSLRWLALKNYSNNRARSTYINQMEKIFFNMPNITELHIDATALEYPSCEEVICSSRRHELRNYLSSLRFLKIKGSDISAVFDQMEAVLSHGVISRLVAIDLETREESNRDIKPITCIPQSVTFVYAGFDENDVESYAELNKYLPDSCKEVYVDRQSSKMMKIAGFFENRKVLFIKNMCGQDDESDADDQNDFSPTSLVEAATIELKDEEPLAPISYDLMKKFYRHPDDKSPEILPQTYRDAVFKSLEVYIEDDEQKVRYRVDDLSVDGDSIPIPYESGDLRMKFLDHEFDEQDKETIFAKDELCVSRDWANLASASPQEELKAITFLSKWNAHLEMMYFRSERLYKIRLKEDSCYIARKINIHIEYVLSLPGNWQVHKVLPEEFREDIQHFSNFEQRDLDNPNKLCGLELVELYTQQQVGRCEVRSLAFFVKQAKNGNEHQFRVITNKSHAYIEFVTESEWLRLDLGGYPAEINIVNEEEECDLIEYKINKRAKDEKMNNESALDEHILTSMKREVNNTLLKDKCEIHDVMIRQVPSSVNRLITFPHVATLNDYARDLIQYCQSIGRKYILINTPNQLRCSRSKFLKNPVTQLWENVEGLFGAMHEFITSVKMSGDFPVVIVNYSNFKPSDIVSTNSLIDKDPTFYAIELPKDMCVVGLVSQDIPNQYMGSDFWSRFNFIFNWEENDLLPLADFESPCAREMAVQIPDRQVIELDFNYSNEWSTFIKGNWQFNEGCLTYCESEFEEALRRGEFDLIIKRAPWSNLEFQLYIMEMRKHYVQVRIFRSEESDVRERLSSVSAVKLMPKNAIALNPLTLKILFSRYVIDENSQVVQDRGLVGDCSHDKVEFYITHNLSESDWEAFYKACDSRSITPVLYRPESLRLYDENEIICAGSTQECSDAMSFPMSLSGHSPQTDVIVSDDCDITIDMIKTEIPCFVWDIGETPVGDVLGKIQVSYDKTRQKFVFSHVQSLLKKYLDNSQTVILTGIFSANWLNAISLFMLTREHHRDPSPGNLFIVVETCKGFEFSKIRRHCISPEVKQDYLNHKRIPFDIHNQNQYTYTQLLAISIQARPWNGMESLVSDSNHVEMVMDYSQLNNVDLTILAQNFDEKRRNSIEAILKVQPYVCITGLTGVGKTTFIKNEGDSKRFHLFSGIDSLKDWTESNASGTDTIYSILFIDEANLDDKKLSLFEGLFHEPKGILVENQWITLTDRHKIIFSMNPSHYDYERKTPVLLLRHGNAVIFEPIPPAYLYIKIIKPELEKVLSKIHRLGDGVKPEHVYPLLSYIQFMSDISDNDVLVTPREILYMLHLALASWYYDNPNNEEFTEVLKHYVTLLGRHWVPQRHSLAFDERFQTSFLIATPPGMILFDKYLVTQSRLPVYFAIKDLLFFKHYSERLNQIDYTGIRSIVLQGEPGVGKSELLLGMLKYFGYYNADLESDAALTTDSNSVIAHKRYYMISASLSVSDKKRLLLKAFHGGAIVIMEEMNSSPMIEQFLNVLLMGCDPEGNLAERAGFIVMGTQNPAFLEGRIEASPAIKHRVITLTMENLPRTEMIEILEHHGVPSGCIEPIVDCYLRNFNSKKQLCFRDMIRYATSTDDIQKLLVVIEDLNMKLLAEKESDIKIIHATKRPRKSESYSDLDSDADSQAENTPPTKWRRISDQTRLRSDLNREDTEYMILARDWWSSRIIKPPYPCGRLFSLSDNQTQPGTPMDLNESGEGPSKMEIDQTEPWVDQVLNL